MYEDQVRATFCPGLVKGLIKATEGDLDGGVTALQVHSPHHALFGGRFGEQVGFALGAFPDTRERHQHAAIGTFLFSHLNAIWL